MNNKQTVLVILGIALFGLPTLLTQCFETINPNEIAVIQTPLTGTLTWHTTQGTKWQGGGSVTLYPKLSQLTFSQSKTDGDKSIRVRFNDGGHANIIGSLSWELPDDPEKLTEIHTKYHSPEQLESQLLRPALAKAIYYTGPIMSTAESASSRRAEFLSLVEDQFLKGVYQTAQRDERTADPTDGGSKSIKVIEILKDKATGMPLRAEESAIEHLGIRITNPNIADMIYDEDGEGQISALQRQFIEVQTAIAETRTASQKALTVEAKGMADAKEAEWKQKVIAAQAQAEAEQKAAVATVEAEMKKAVAIMEAQQQLEAAQLLSQAAEQKKLAAILEAEGQAEAKKLLLTADGGLSAKLEAYVAVNKEFANAIGQYQGSWVPSVVMAPSSPSTTTTSGGGGASALIDMLTVKTAKDLALDLGMPATSASGLREISRPAPSTFKPIKPLPPAPVIPTTPVKATTPVTPPPSAESRPEASKVQGS